MFEKNSSVKACNECHELKPLSDFSKDKARKDGVQCSCKDCKRLHKNAYNHTKTGLISQIYSNQRSHSKERNHDLPNYTKLELTEWLFSQPNFDRLYLNWINSGYSKAKTPSCDRLDDYASYTLDNFRLVTWAENEAKGHSDMKAGINTKSSKPVNQLTLDGKLTKKHYSINQAARATGAHLSGISSCCNGRYKTSGGFRWILA